MMNGKSECCQRFENYDRNSQQFQQDGAMCHNRYSAFNLQKSNNQQNKLASTELRSDTIGLFSLGSGKLENLVD